jgi:hypothetical protein
VPIASRSAASLVHGREIQVLAGLKDEKTYSKQAAVDAFRDTPGQNLLTGLHGKDVVVSFIESYGRSAVQDPRYAAQVDSVLDAGTGKLAKAGFSSRSGWLTSPTAGGGSWLAHSTFHSGLWISNQQRYRSLTSSDRFTLGKAFNKASWQTVAVEPGTTRTWPEAKFFGYQRVYPAEKLGYHGPSFSWSTMPDQYTMAAFERSEYSKPHDPMMAEVTLTSSHTPWAPIPKFIGWDKVGDGSVYGPMARAQDPPAVVWRDSDRVRTQYRQSIEYSLNSLISFVEKYGNDNLVLVFLGDHQPAPIITGPGASRDVPVTIVAHDPKVLDRIAGWGWQDGLRPGPKAPVWKMSAFRDRFLTAFAH